MYINIYVYIYYICIYVCVYIYLYIYKDSNTGSYGAEETTGELGIGDIKGIFYARMGTIKDRNGKDLTEEEEIKKK